MFIFHTAALISLRAFPATVLSLHSVTEPCRTCIIESDKRRSRRVDGFLWTFLTSGVCARGRSFNIHLQNQQEHTWISVYLHDLREPNTHSSHLTDISGMQNTEKKQQKRLSRTVPSLSALLRPAADKSLNINTS